MQLVRSEWVLAIALWQRMETDETLMRAVNAERRYTFAWRRYRQMTCHGRRKVAVKHPDPAVGWQVVRL